MKTRNTLLAILSAGLVALSALAVPVMAQDDNETSDSDSHSQTPRDQREAAKERMEAQKEAAKEHREAAKEQAKEAREHAKARCAESNATLNDTEQRGCDKKSPFHGHALKARREAHALMGAIEAIERRIGKLEVREMALEDQLASGNFSQNQTAESIQEAIAKIEEHQERLAERLVHLEARVVALHEKWAAVRDHVESRRHGSDDEDDADDDSSSSDSSSSSQSESVSSSASQTSTSPA